MIGLNSVDNEQVAELYFHSLLGAYFNNALIRTGVNGKDLRMSVFWIQQSRTGKGEANKAFQKICEAIGIKIATVTEVTTAGLIGSIDSDAISYNKKNNLSPDNTTKIVANKAGDSMKTYEYQDPIIKGDLANYDILIFDEAKTLLQTGNYTENLLSNLQPTLDHPGYVRKKLRHETPIEYKCSPTILATTYYFGEISKVLAEQGFFQRVVMFIRDMSIPDIKHMRQQQRSLMIKKDSRKEFNEKLAIFTKRLLKYDREKLTMLRITTEATDSLMDLGNRFIYNIERNLTGNDLYVALSFTNTLQEMALKVAAQYAILQERQEISSANIKQGFQIIRTYINTIINKLEISDDVVETDVKKIILSFKKYRSANNQVPKTAFRDYLAQEAGWGKNKASKKIQKVLYLNYLREYTGETHNVKLLAEVS